jgi:hypothetical protein
VVAASSFLRPSRAAVLLFSCFVEELSEKRMGETKKRKAKRGIGGAFSSPALRPPWSAPP